MSPMYDHSYNLETLDNVLRKGDFRGISEAGRAIFREDSVKKALQSASTMFNNRNPLIKFHLRKKSAYRLERLEDDLVVRKLAKNLQAIAMKAPSGRSRVVINLRHFLEEGVPYRLYKLDIKGFYESFEISGIIAKIISLRKLSLLSKKHFEVLLSYYKELGGTGLPRGMALSAIVSDMLMSDFDAQVFSYPTVYFYGRYVDDIVIVTNLTENKEKLSAFVNKTLPKKLVLNDKKTAVKEIGTAKSSNSSSTFSVSYLGYQFSVDPAEVKRAAVRTVSTEIAPAKMKKIKTRIVRTFLDFQKTNDLSLLTDRIKYLTSNFSIRDTNTGKRRLAGIYYSYPLLPSDSESLKLLDNFLRNAIYSTKGRVFCRLASVLTTNDKRKLLANSFARGYNKRRFVHFSPAKINNIQRCWKYE